MPDCRPLSFTPSCQKTRGRYSVAASVARLQLRYKTTTYAVLLTGFALLAGTPLHPLRGSTPPKNPRIGRGVGADFGGAAASVGRGGVAALVALALRVVSLPAPIALGEGEDDGLPPMPPHSYSAPVPLIFLVLYFLTFALP